MIRKKRNLHNVLKIMGKCSIMIEELPNMEGLKNEKKYYCIICGRAFFRLGGPDYGLGSSDNCNGALYNKHHSSEKISGIKCWCQNPNGYANRPSIMLGCRLALAKNE